jgi:hypothetical protein
MVDRVKALLVLAVVGAAGAGAAAQDVRLPTLSLQQEPESVYAPPLPPRDDRGVNEGGVRLDLTVSYFTDYVYRGLELFELPEFNPTLDTSEDRANLQINGKLSFDLGKAPHPFVGAFVNVAESDPISTFEEIRPYLGIDWNLRPLLLTAGYASYIYPDRDQLETQEVYARLELDDSYFLRGQEPLLSPYVLVAYDIDLYDGWYVEAGVGHNFRFEDIGLTLRAEANVAWVSQFELFDADPTDTNDEPAGLQHYQLGLIGTYSLNELLNVSRRYGEWSFVGYLYYTDGIDDDLEATTQLWGGAGISFKY